MNRRQRGFALILVIWSLVLLASLATGFALAVRHEIRVAGDMASAARAEAAATAALHLAALSLSAAAREQRWPADTEARDIPWPDARIRVRVQSESGRIDINRAPRELLAGLFTQIFPGGSGEALVDALLDWRDPDDDPGPAGAERAAYAQAGYAYAPANAPFQSLGQLRRVIGFDDRIVETVSPYLTVYSRRPRINVLGADLIVLMAVPGIDADTASTLIAQRSRALAGGDTLDFGAIPAGGRQYLESRPNDKLFSVDIDVLLDDGLRRREHAVIQLTRTQGYALLARETRAVGPLPDDSRQ